MIHQSRSFFVLVSGERAACRPIASTLVMAFILLCLPALSGAQQSCLPDGDVNQDGSITAADALLAFQQALGAAEPPLSVCEQVIADVHPVPGAADGNLTAADALCIFRKALGLASCLDAVGGQPVAESISFRVDPASPYADYQLMGTDPDGDTLTYELLDDPDGTGYADAVVGPQSGILFLTLATGFSGEILLQYRVTDGRLFSEPATIRIFVETAAEDQALGSLDIPPEEYALLVSADRAGADDLPPQMDLSPFFPIPGNQGTQSSCVGWATAYALKSYQERLEMGWTFTRNHIFSPAYIYNQINGGSDGGSRVDHALDLIVEQGAATLASMPYEEDDHSSQPSAEARLEAAGFKAARKERINGSRDIKAALAARTPVVVGILSCDNFDDLKGRDAVYNDLLGECGGHAVTVTGYDDSRFGGAFRIINSWGSDWGDAGYFWLPYSLFRRAVNYAFILVDADNSDPVLPIVNPPPLRPVSDLPNLQVRDWSATYDPRPRGEGLLEYTVINTGLEVAESGADVNLMLSVDRTFNSNDYFVVWETISFDLDPGETVFRDADNPLAFSFPDGLPAGAYWMAVWVDDLGFVAESREDDNVSIGESRLTIENALPDLYVRNWYAEWDGSGDGTLTYRVENIGQSAADSGLWDINLVLSPDELIGNGDETFLFFEPAEHLLEPGGYVFRDESNPAYFNLYVDAFEDVVHFGTYYMALWVDDLELIEESNELNNYSLGGDQVQVLGSSAPSVAGRRGRGLRPAGAGALSAGKDLYVPERRALNRLYNGHELPDRQILVREVEIKRTPQGGISLSVTGDETFSAVPHSLPLSATDGGKEFPPHAKQQQSANSVIFPVVEELAMPENSSGNQGGK